MKAAPARVHRLTFQVRDLWIQRETVRQASQSDISVGELAMEARRFFIVRYMRRNFSHDAPEVRYLAKRLGIDDLDEWDRFFEEAMQKTSKAKS